jgi:hypothetical protein
MEIKQNSRHSGKELHGLFGRFAMEKKKTVVALCLIAAMVLMWARVLLKSGPNSVEASLLDAQADSAKEAAPQVKVSFVELPQIPGRNDLLTGDFFDADGWRNFIAGTDGGVQKVSVISRDGSEEVTRRLVAKLNLQAIWLDRNPQAFINDSLLSVGDKLEVREGNEAYECEVAAIEQNRVLIRCREAEITLKLSGDLDG